MKVLLRTRIYALWNEKSDVRLLDVLRSTSLGGALRKESEYADFSSQSTHLHALATDPHE